MATLLDTMITAISNAIHDKLRDPDERDMDFFMSPPEKKIFSYILGAHQLGTPLKDIAKEMAEMGKDDNPGSPDGSSLCRAYLKRRTLTKYEINHLKRMEGSFCEISHKYADIPDWNIKYKEILFLLDPDFKGLIENN